MGRGDGDACAGMTPDGKCGGNGEACGRENMADGACQEGEASADGSGTGSKDSATNCEPAGQPAIARRSAQQAMREQREGELEQLNEDAELHTLVKAATKSEPPTERGRGTARPTCTPRGLPGYRFRSARQVAPAVAIAIVPLATFHEQKRYRQTGGPDRLSGVAAFVLSVEAGTRNEMGLDEYVVVHGRARTTEGGAPELLQQLARVYLGPDVKFPPMDDPTPGYITHITVERIGGVGRGPAGSAGLTLPARPAASRRWPGGFAVRPDRAARRAPFPGARPRRAGASRAAAGREPRRSPPGRSSL
jgi:hypothetical protein